MSTTRMQYTESIGTQNIEQILQYHFIVSSTEQTNKVFLRTENNEEEPSKMLLSTIKKARENRREGKASPIFSTVAEMKKWYDEQDE